MLWPGLGRRILPVPTLLTDQTCTQITFNHSKPGPFLGIPYSASAIRAPSSPPVHPTSCPSSFYIFHTPAVSPNTSDHHNNSPASDNHNNSPLPPPPPPRPQQLKEYTTHRNDDHRALRSPANLRPRALRPRRPRDLLPLHLPHLRIQLHPHQHLPHGAYA